MPRSRSIRNGAVPFVYETMHPILEFSLLATPKRPATLLIEVNTITPTIFSEAVGDSATLSALLWVYTCCTNDYNQVLTTTQSLRTMPNSEDCDDTEHNYIVQEFILRVDKSRHPC